MSDSESQQPAKKQRLSGAEKKRLAGEKKEFRRKTAREFLAKYGHCYGEKATRAALTKFDGGSNAVQPGSWPKTGESNQQKAKELVAENQRSVGNSAASAGGKLGVSAASAYRLFKTCNCKSVAPMKADALADAQKTKRLETRLQPLEMLKGQEISSGAVWFIDESGMGLNKLWRHSKNRSLWIDESAKLGTSPRRSPTIRWPISPRGLRLAWRFPKAVEGETKPRFCPDGATIGGSLYKSMVDDHYSPEIRRQMRQAGIPDAGWQGQEDGAKSRKGEVAQDYWANRPRFVLPWPANSPDLAPCDYGLRRCFASHVTGKAPKSLDELEDAIVDVAVELPGSALDSIIDAWPARLARCVELEGDNVGKNAA